MDSRVLTLIRAQAVEEHDIPPPLPHSVAIAAPAATVQTRPEKDADTVVQRLPYFQVLFRGRRRTTIAGCLPPLLQDPTPPFFFASSRFLEGVFGKALGGLGWVGVDYNKGQLA